MGIELDRIVNFAERSTDEFNYFDYLKCSKCDKLLVRPIRLKPCRVFANNIFAKKFAKNIFR